MTAVERSSRPSVAELRAVGQPPSVLTRAGAEHWSGRLYMRRVSIHLTRLLVPTRVSPDAVTVAMALSGVAAAVVLTDPSVWAALGAFVLLQLQVLLDCSDGELARWRGPSGGARGAYLDGIAHTVTDAAVLAGLGVHADGGLSSVGGWTTLGLVAAIGSLLVHEETNIVYQARARAGLPPPTESAVVPQVGAVRQLRSLLRRLPVNRLLSAWDLSYVVLPVAVVDAAVGSLRPTRGLVVALLVIAAYATSGHLLSVLTSRRLR